MPRTQILLQPHAPLDMRPEQLQSLAEAIRALDPEYDVRIAYYDQGYGLTWWEVLGLWFSSTLGTSAINQIARVATDWLIDRKKSGPRNSDRPKVVRLVKYTGETGETIELLEIHDLDTGVERKPPDLTHPQSKPPIRDDEDPEEAFWIWRNKGK